MNICVRRCARITVEIWPVAHRLTKIVGIENIVKKVFTSTFFLSLTHRVVQFAKLVMFKCFKADFHCFFTKSLLS